MAGIKWLGFSSLARKHLEALPARFSGVAAATGVSVSAGVTGGTSMVDPSLGMKPHKRHDAS